MSIRYIIRIVGIVTCFGFFSFGQAIESEELSRGAGAVSADKTARQLAEDAIGAKGWVEGVNKTKSGSDFFVAIGTGDIQAPINDPAYLTSRANAFDKAQLAGWAEIRRFVGETISANAKSAYEEVVGEIPKAEEQTVTQTKLAALLDGILNKSLEKVGVDPASATPEQKEKAMSTEEFSKSVSSIASGPIVGVQAYATFEGQGSGKGYQIAVVSIWSDKLQKMAESMFTLSKMPAGVPGKSVSSWIPTDNSQLLTTFGVQMVSDEAGLPVLIAYGQARPVSESSRSVDAAFSKAQMEARSYLRFFAGSQAKVMDDFSKAESTEEFADGTKAYTSAESFQQVVDVVAPAEKFSGISRIKTWSQVHPITKKTIAGAVIMWRPESALLANAVGAKMAAPPRASASQSTAVSAPARQSLDASGKGLTGSGALASDDF